MHLSMSSESLHEILGTYSAIEALKKLARLDRPEDDLDSSCVCFSNIRVVSDAFCCEEPATENRAKYRVLFVGYF